LFKKIIKNRRKSSAPVGQIISLRVEMRRGFSRLLILLKRLIAATRKAKEKKPNTVPKWFLREIKSLRAELRYTIGSQKTGLILPLIRLERMIRTNTGENKALLRKIAFLESSGSFSRETPESAARQGFSQGPGLEGRIRMLERRLQAAEENYIKEKQILEYKVKSAQAETDKYRLELSVKTMFDKNEKGER